MIKSSSSFGLPSESYNDNISDKEIMSDRGIGASGPGVGLYNSNKKSNSPSGLVKSPNNNLNNMNFSH